MSILISLIENFVELCVLFFNAYEFVNKWHLKIDDKYDCRHELRNKYFWKKCKFKLGVGLPCVTIFL